MKTFLEQTEKQVQRLARLINDMLEISRIGLGLGLFISNKIFKAHDGTIKVDSSLGKGATFIVRLPLHSF